MPPLNIIDHPALRRVFISMTFLCALWILAGGAAYWRFASYARAHGDGVPDRDMQDRPIMNNHGKITRVSEEVYREARSRMNLAFAAVAVCIVLVLLTLLRYNAKVKHLCREEGNTEDQRP